MDEHYDAENYEILEDALKVAEFVEKNIAVERAHVAISLALISACIASGVTEEECETHMANDWRITRNYLKAIGDIKGKGSDE